MSSSLKVHVVVGQYCVKRKQWTDYTMGVSVNILLPKSDFVNLILDIVIYQQLLCYKLQALCKALVSLTKFV